MMIGAGEGETLPEKVSTAYDFLRMRCEKFLVNDFQGLGDFVPLWEKYRLPPLPQTCKIQDVQILKNATVGIRRMREKASLAYPQN